MEIEGMEKKAKVPKLRFPGFTEDWEQRKFGDMVIIERGGSPRPIEKFITNDENGLNWVKIGDAPEQGNYITETKEKIKPEGLKKTREVHPGDLILSNSMSFGRPYIMAIDGCIHDGWLLIRDTNKVFDLKYLCQMLGTDQMLAQYKAMAAGSTVNNLNKELVGNTDVKLPNIEEQVKIGEYFSNLDNLITLHQRKLTHLQAKKKSLLQKMFPKKVERFPELRFPGFTDAWEQRKFGEIVATRRGLTYSPSDICENGVRVLRSSNINGDTFQVSPDDVFVNREAVNIEYASENDILITSANGSSRLVGKHALMLNISDKSTVHGGFMLLATAKEPNFINASMSSDWYKKFIDMYVSGGNGAIGNLSKLDLDSQIIYVPSQLEQKQVGAFFKKLDNLINLHQRKLTHLQTQKKALLQQMFV